MTFDLKEYLKQNSKRKKFEIKAYRRTENFEAELDNFLSFMSQEVGNRYKNQVLNKLNVSVVRHYFKGQK